MYMICESTAVVCFQRQSVFLSQNVVLKVLESKSSFSGESRLNSEGGHTTELNRD